MIFFLTFNDQPSGIFSGQVIDVVKFLREKLNCQVKLVSFVSIRNFSDTKKTIRKQLPDAIVLPMFPKLKNWKKNIVSLKFIVNKYKPGLIIGRSVLATELALMLKEKRKGIKVVYDGRGAIASEWKEYNVVGDSALVNTIYELEKNSILNTDFRIAVSEQLHQFWESEFQYKSNSHVVIPCTLNKGFEKINISEGSIKSSRQLLNIDKETVLLAYSGSIAGWQSFDLLYDFLNPVLGSKTNSKILFLSDKDENIEKLETEFPGKIICKKVSVNDVPKYLMAADFGLLIREESITNKVASPVKFAEYLACGLKVIISDNLGDYSEFTKQHNCGYNYKEFNFSSAPTISEKIQMNKLALEYFTKSNFISQYKKLVTI